MQVLRLLTILAGFLLINACNSSSSADRKITVRDTTITPVNSYAEIFLDSSKVEQYLQQQRIPDSARQSIRSFYNGRNYQYAWFGQKGLNEQASLYYNTLQDYLSYSGDSVLYNPALHQFFDSLANDNLASIPDSTRFLMEMNMSLSFLRYARRAYQGNVTSHQQDLNWFIPRKKINPVEVLDSFLSRKSAIEEPIHPQYGLLKAALLKYYQLQKEGGFPEVKLAGKSLRPGDTAQGVAQLKRRLHSVGDYLPDDTTAVYTQEVQDAVKSFQHRYGLTEDGKVGGTTLKFLNEPIDVRIRQILVNMERMRWVPAQPKGDFILVNIPQFRLTVFEDAKPAFGMRIVVGTDQNKTVIFTGQLKYVVFSPYWNVPPGILKNEVLPAIRRNPSYLARNHMEWNGNTVRQLPGPWNALGQVKFLFPNSYNIYLHDTPSKSLFGESKRSFSHGCIRIQEPEKLANWVLRRQKEWTAEKIRAAMNGSKERFVTVNPAIPVFIGYFTAWVDDKGAIHFRDDIYGHDRKLAEMLFSR